MTSPGSLGTFTGSIMSRLKLGQLLIDAGVITPSQLELALAEQQQRGGKIGDTLVRVGAVREELLVETLAGQLDLPFVHLDEVATVSPDALARVPFELAQRLLAVPLELTADGRALCVGMVEPQHLRHLEGLRAAAGMRIVPRLAGRLAVERALTRLYGAAKSALA